VIVGFQVEHEACFGFRNNEFTHTAHSLLNNNSTMLRLLWIRLNQNEIKRRMHWALDLYMHYDCFVLGPAYGAFAPYVRLRRLLAVANTPPKFMEYSDYLFSLLTF
jgi:hypothetical protein